MGDWRSETVAFTERADWLEGAPMHERIDADLMMRVAQQIIDHPDEHSQQTYINMTTAQVPYFRSGRPIRDCMSTACAAGWTAILDGARLDAWAMKGFAGQDVILDRTAEVGSHQYAWTRVGIHEYAQVALGLTIEEAEFLFHLGLAVDGTELPDSTNLVVQTMVRIASKVRAHGQ